MIRKADGTVERHIETTGDDDFPDIRQQRLPAAQQQQQQAQQLPYYEQSNSNGSGHAPDGDNSGIRGLLKRATSRNTKGENKSGGGGNGHHPATTTASNYVDMTNDVNNASNHQPKATKRTKRNSIRKDDPHDIDE